MLNHTHEENEGMDRRGEGDTPVTIARPEGR